MAPDPLPHAAENCTGEWRLQGKRGAGFWRCDGCGAEHPSTPDTDRESDREFGLGMLMRNQARRHRLRHILEAPQEPPPFIEFPRDEEEPKEPWQE